MACAGALKSHVEQFRIECFPIYRRSKVALISFHELDAGRPSRTFLFFLFLVPPICFVLHFKHRIIIIYLIAARVCVCVRQWVSEQRRSFGASITHVLFMCTSRNPAPACSFVQVNWVNSRASCERMCVRLASARRIYMLRTELFTWIQRRGGKRMTIFHWIVRVPCVHRSLLNMAVVNH